jgi:S1-C subfamily serine protease
MLRCPACGSGRKPDERFCRTCGAPVATAGDPRMTPRGTPRRVFVETSRPASGLNGPTEPITPDMLPPPASTSAWPPAPAVSGSPPQPERRASKVTSKLRPRPSKDAGALPAIGALQLRGPRGDQRDLPLMGVQEAVIGREPPAHLVLPDAGVSREHARLVRRDGSFELWDLGSRNGTYVNGEPLRGRHVLAPGDEIEIGPYRLRARPRDTGSTAHIDVRRRPNRHTGMIAVVAGSVLAAGAVAAGVAIAIGRGGGGGGQAAPAATQVVAATIPPSTEQQIAEVAERVRPSVVRIRTRTTDATGVGTGIIMEDGYVITNEHVVKGDPNPSVTLADGRTVRGQVLGVDAVVDLAVLKLEETGLPVAAWGDSDALRPGERLIAIGFALGFTGEPSVTSGIFSGKREFQGQTYVQTDTAINQGNSGGPLLNLKGEVIGINDLVVGRNSSLQAQGINLAIPAAVAQIKFPELRDKTASPPPTATASRSVTQAPALTYRSAMYGYSLGYPSGWKVDESNPTIVKISGDGGVIGITVEDLPRNVSLKEYADAAIASQQRALQEFTVTRRTTGRLNSGAPAELLSVTWVQNGVKLEGSEAILVQDRRGYAIFGVAEQSQYSRVSGKIDDSLQSFVLK